MMWLGISNSGLSENRMFGRFRSEGQKIRGMWIFQWMALVAVVSSAHSLTIVFLNGFHGYFILKIKAADWIVVSFFQRL